MKRGECILPQRLASPRPYLEACSDGIHTNYKRRDRKCTHLIEQTHFLSRHIDYAHPNTVDPVSTLYLSDNGVCINSNRKTDSGKGDGGDEAHDNKCLNAEKSSERET